MEVCSLTTLGSSSSGNCYIIQCGKEKLIIEAGIKIKEVLNALNYEVNSVAGVIVSHRATLRPL